jgi:hypothetical protein
MPARAHAHSTAVNGTKASSPRRSRASSRSPKTVPNQIAIGYRPGCEADVRDALAPFGTLEVHPRSSLIILHREPGISRAKLSQAIQSLQKASQVEFATPVLRDPDSQLRQVLTNEIVVRLKPGDTRRTIAALSAEHGLEVGRRNRYEPTQYIVKIPRTLGTQPLDVARAIDRHADVEFASPNFLTGIKR